MRSDAASPPTGNPYPELKQSQAIATAGELFADGSAIEPVCNPTTSELSLLLWGGQPTTIARAIVHRERTYVPAAVPSDLLEAITLPTRQAAYRSPQSLFFEISEMLSRYTTLSEEGTSLVTFFIFASWFSEFLPTAPCLLITGSAEYEARTLLRILRCVCRHALLLAELNPTSFAGLPFFLQPTVLLLQREVRSQFESQLLASNARGICESRNGKVLDLFCAKAIYSPRVVPESRLAESSMLVSIGPGPAALPVFDERAEEGIKTTLLPKLLRYRLANALSVKNSRFDVPRFTAPIREVARSLGKAVEADPELQARLVVLLKGQDAELQVERWDPVESVLIETLLFFCHAGKDRVRVGEIQKAFAAIFLGRGEKLELKDRAIGARLKSLGFHTASLGSQGRGLFLTQNICRRVHNLGQLYGVRALQSGKPRCALCTELSSAESGRRREADEGGGHPEGSEGR